ncbi:hypothetical protein GCM10011344_08770 [Dokdonia pacifica]|uniref:Uncharacterized protein n=1 Tax=Dokdonia pacifica TaxID=1627892 RepID=A0A238YS62_9FLAO|nr:hypothetical protein [Dokdonia pacifica]GGG10353.1 hypothetical protein GCM10011344_08770 [Dokdonia pacifica]SNR73987.1 hypothetical protein SAMN06265376_102320 [Dokdonia pacifica]
MKLRIVSLLCLFLAIACSTDEVNNTETATADNSITLNQKIVDQLLEDGYKAAITDDNKIVSTGYKDPESFVKEMNAVFEKIGESNRKIDFNALSTQADTTRDVQCEMGDIDEDNCVTFVCWGPELEPLSMGFAGENHYVYWTSC